MKIIVHNFLLILSMMSFFNVSCSVQVAANNLDLYTTTAFELLAFNYGLSLESHIAHISELVFGRADPGYIIFTQKLMRQTCKSALHLVKKPLVFYNYVLSQFSKNMAKQPTSQKSPQTHQITSSKNLSSKKMRFLKALIIIIIISGATIFYVSHSSLEQEMDNFNLKLDPLRSKMDECKESISELKKTSLDPMNKKIETCAIKINQQREKLEGLERELQERLAVLERQQQINTREIERQKASLLETIRTAIEEHLKELMRSRAGAAGAAVWQTFSGIFK